ncbi:MAG: sugar phosphate isomerase/epimerase family protein [Mycoplasmatales bacterium]
MNFGVQLYSVREHLTEEQLKSTLMHLKSSGFDYVEIFNYESIEKFQMFVTLCTELDLAISGAHVGIEELLTKQDEINEMIALANLKYIAIPCINSSKRDRISFEKLAVDLEKICALYPNVEILYHNHAFEFPKIDEESGFEILLKNSKVKFQFDTHWLHQGGYDVVDFLEKNQSRIGSSMHIKEVQTLLKSEWEVETIDGSIGTGNLPIKKIVEVCQKQINYLTLEQEVGQTDDILNDLRIGLRNVKKVLDVHWKW